jgi:hypothetical protein
MLPVEDRDLQAAEKMKKVDNELEIASLASETGFAPQVARVDKCTGTYRSKKAKIGIIVMEKYDTTLLDLIKQDSPAIRDEKMVRSKVEGVAINLLKKGIDQNDYHPGNVLINLDSNGNIKDLVLSDFGQARLSPSGSYEAGTIASVKMTIKVLLLFMELLKLLGKFHRFKTMEECGGTIIYSY